MKQFPITLEFSPCKLLSAMALALRLNFISVKVSCTWVEILNSNQKGGVKSDYRAHFNNPQPIQYEAPTNLCMIFIYLKSH